jgi:hypothetical protein
MPPPPNENPMPGDLPKENPILGGPPPKGITMLGWIP